MGICCMTQGTSPGAPWQSRGEGRGGRKEEVQEGADICISMADWCLSVAETNTILKSNYPKLKINKLKKKKQKRWMRYQDPQLCCTISSDAAESLSHLQALKAWYLSTLSNGKII